MAKRRGRPSGYDPNRHPFLAQVLARVGLTDEEIAQKIGIAPSTLSEWKKAHPEFSESLKGGKPEADARVVDSLYRRALGYEYEETEIVADKGQDGQAKPARVKRVKKHMAPDVTACIFWLKNRQPEKWRDVVRQEHTGAGGGPIEVARREEYHVRIEQVLQDPEARGAARDLWRRTHQVER